MMAEVKIDFDSGEVRFDESGLVPAIVQDAATKEVLTLAYMNGESLRRTLETGETHFWSRSRAELWHKGATSGNTQHVVEIRRDCDADALVVLVDPNGPACHTGAHSCFGGDGAAEQAIEDYSLGVVLEKLYALVETRRAQRPEGSYTTYLFDKGIDKILKKIGEESAETIIAAKNPEHEPLVAEMSDLLFHLTVLMVERGVRLEDLKTELARRAAK